LAGDAVAATTNVTTASPVTIALPTAGFADGSLVFKARAHSADLTADSATRTLVLDNAKPVVSLQLERLSILKKTAKVEFTVADAHLAKIQLLADDAVVAEIAGAATSLWWDTTKTEDGLRKVKLSVVDAAGNTEVTSEQLVVVANTALVPEIEYDPRPLVSVPPNWQSVEIDVRGMVTNPGGVKRMLSWLTWDPALDMNLEYALGLGLCPHRGIKIIDAESRKGEIIIEIDREDVAASVASKFPAGSDPKTFPVNDDPATLGTIFGHIAVLDAADHVNESVPVEMHFVLFK
ncbi:MAG: hypothetical protein HY901_10615, partial [Deltaproteobacteria bacterium]|nr:hypothetical protein [Deltaproteobacteria bacterium]